MILGSPLFSEVVFILEVPEMRRIAKFLRKAYVYAVTDKIATMTK